MRGFVSGFRPYSFLVSCNLLYWNFWSIIEAVFITRWRARFSGMMPQITRCKEYIFQDGLEKKTPKAILQTSTARLYLNSCSRLVRSQQHFRESTHQRQRRQSQAISEEETGKEDVRFQTFHSSNFFAQQWHLDNMEVLNNSTNKQLSQHDSFTAQHPKKKSPRHITHKPLSNISVVDPIWLYNVYNLNLSPGTTIGWHRWRERRFGRSLILGLVARFRIGIGIRILPSKGGSVCGRTRIREKLTHDGNESG